MSWNDKKKIAILGSAPSSCMLAPFKDESWAIWCVSPALYPQVPRSDAWFELHRFTLAQPGKNGEPGTRPHHSAEFGAFLKQHKGPVFMSEVHPDIPTSVRLPYEHLNETFGPYFWQSSMSWMLALAIDLKPDEIGLWGVDMSATEEWSYQRPACQHFVGLAIGLGIKVTIPPESDLMRPPTMYGIGELSERYIKLSARLAEHEAQRAVITAQHNECVQRLNYLQGGIDATKYVLQSWADDVNYDPSKAMSFAHEYAKTKPLASISPLKIVEPAVTLIDDELVTGMGEVHIAR